MLKIFNTNYEEVGSLDKNLVLNTLGKIKIRYHKKFIDLLDNNGNLNVSIPKILQSAKSTSEISSDGLYIVDDNLYVYYNGNLILLSGEEGTFIDYGSGQDLNQLLISTALKNIGLTFSSESEALQSVSKGIVFIGNKIYYAQSGKLIELPLKECLSSVNESGLSSTPEDWNSAIVYLNGWKYVPVVTLEEFNNYKISLTLEEDSENPILFDFLVYSKAYNFDNLLKFDDLGITFDAEEKPEEGEELVLNVRGFYCNEDAQPLTRNVIRSYSLNLGECLIPKELEEYAIDIEALKEKMLNLLHYEVDEDGNKINLNYEYSSCKITSPIQLEITPDTEDISIENIKEIEYITFEREEIEELWDTYSINLKYIEGVLQLEKDQEYKEIEDLYIIKINDSKWFCITNASKYLYSKSGKLKIDYKNAEINLNNDVIIGNIKANKTYKDKNLKFGLFSDLSVFVGSEFREPINNTSEDVEVYNFPRYSELLNTILCEKHLTDELFNNVIPSIKWIKSLIFDSFPPGTILMWGKSEEEIPYGWAICNGENGTPNLIGKFIKGGNNESLAKEGGSNELILTSENMPKHSHWVYNYLTQVHGNSEIYAREILDINGKKMTVSSVPVNNNPTKRAQTDDSGHSDLPFILHTTEPSGNSEPTGIDNQPEYYTLIYIMKVK